MLSRHWGLRECLHRYCPLQDAVDLDMATDEEKAALTEWQKYVVLLSRVDVNATDIEWPEQPM
ncbi:tail fiber assembly protein [Symbiopectobacterium sp. RP]